MKVILKSAVPNVGQAGEIKEVKKGFGFNYLLPQGLADLATPGAIKSIQAVVAKQNQAKTEKISALSASVKKLDGKKFIIKAKAEDGKLFGSVTKADIVKAAHADGVEIVDDMIELEHPIKAIGEYAVVLRAGDTKAKVTVTVSAE